MQQLKPLQWKLIVVKDKEFNKGLPPQKAPNVVDLGVKSNQCREFPRREKIDKHLKSLEFNINFLIELL